jgi:hypothetical protein
MSIPTLENNIYELFPPPNFVNAEELSTEFKFRPDIVLRDNSRVIAFIIRKSNSIPIEFIDKYAEITSFPELATEKFIAFPSKPVEEIRTKCLEENNIGICYLNKGKLILEVPKIDVQKRVLVANTPVYEMPSAQIFFSSIEELPERIKGKQIVERINVKYKKPIYPHLIERDKKLRVMTPRELSREIMEGIYNDEYFLGILTEDYAQAVEEEIQTALKKDDLENMILLVKNNDQTRKTWGAILTDIEIRFQSRWRTPWYTKFDDMDDFEETLRKEIMDLISRKYKANGSTFL